MRLTYENVSSNVRRSEDPDGDSDVDKDVILRLTPQDPSTIVLRNENTDVDCTVQSVARNTQADVDCTVQSVVLKQPDVDCTVQSVARNASRR